ncbi:bcl-2-binding component 3 [Astyanax mexicanus]|uniref:bcl-2-binding component 3 n=1 Tax=Astyanax mexicanus TaxID=7994 RepID=UPI0020CB03AD|nr:bcl-2-binding component 3 [Astyanax mexicanus]XP_049323132.1 bcl-2-binding component 3 [Astyanax mexicanus]
MARPQMDSRADGQSPTSQQSCRMEALRRDVWPSGSTQPAPQPRHRHRTTANQTSPAPQPLAPMQDALSEPRVPQQNSLLRDNTSTAGTEQERPRPTESNQPLPDLLLQSHSSSSNSSHRDSPADEEPTPEEQAIHRVAIQLRTIGDDMNTVYLQRRNEAPQWQNWRGLYRGLVAFLADTISTLYQHGLR